MNLEVLAERSRGGFDLVQPRGVAQVEDKPVNQLFGQAVLEQRKELVALLNRTLAAT